MPIPRLKGGWETSGYHLDMEIPLIEEGEKEYLAISARKHRVNEIN